MLVIECKKKKKAGSQPRLWIAVSLGFFLRVAIVKFQLLIISTVAEAQRRFVQSGQRTIGMGKYNFDLVS